MLWQEASSLTQTGLSFTTEFHNFHTALCTLRARASRHNAARRASDKVCQSLASSVVCLSTNLSSGSVGILSALG